MFETGRPDGEHPMVVGVALVGGLGERARPVTLKAPGQIRSKAAMVLCGRKVIRWLLESLRAQGLRNVIVVVKGRENRYQTRAAVGFGEDLGMTLRYTPVPFDALNTGSADAAVRDMDYWRIDAPALVFPTDSLFEFSLAGMLACHERNAAVVTMASMCRSRAEVVGKYGVMLTAEDGRLTSFLEKPTASELARVFGPPPWSAGVGAGVPTNAGMYLVDSLGVRKYAQDDEAAERRQIRLDFGQDFLPWLVQRGIPVFAHPVSRVGDLGTVPDYLRTMRALLAGEFISLLAMMGKPVDTVNRIWIPPETLQLPDPVTGKTLEEKLNEDLVRIRGNVRLGRYVEVAAGVTIVDSSVDDDVVIGEGAHIAGSALRDGAVIGGWATIDRAYIGTMAHVASSRRHRTVIAGYSALGDEATVGQGALLAGCVSVYPRVAIPAGIAIADGSHIRGDSF